MDGQPCSLSDIACRVADIAMETGGEVPLRDILARVVSDSGISASDAVVVLEYARSRLRDKRRIARLESMYDGPPDEPVSGEMLDWPRTGKPVGDPPPNPGRRVIRKPGVFGG